MAWALNNIDISTIKDSTRKPLSRYSYKVKLNTYLKNVRYKDSTGSDIFFNDKGELPGNYDIINQILLLDSEQKEKILNRVGTFNSLLPDNQQMHIEIRNIIWKHDTGLSAMCPAWDFQPCALPGSFQPCALSAGFLPCALSVGPCQCGHSFLTIKFPHLLITTVIVVIFFSFRDTPIVKANNRNLSFVLLVSLKLSFLCVFLFIGRPLDITCMIRHISFGMAFSAALSCVLAKTIMVCIAFKATKPGSIWRNWVGLKMSNAVVLVGSSGQVLISVVWLLVAPPFQELDMHTFTGKIIVQCNEGSVLAFFCMLGYMGLLAAVSFVLAFMVRTLPDNFNEAKHITFSMLVFCSVWVCAIPAYLSSKGKNMVAVEIFATLTSSLGIVSCIYLPKCYVIVFKADLNTRRHILIKTIS
ncbi:vomeronasal type-2 receptor 26-like [Spea bombifrons]|uniref:vomeronasal type-2 receptor 26-like n=1 Tax=Spea bombifrons TaxID=233779 RepID=UPI0023496964|nr:vomeronasal type-2 receptor 26-like [Spea bombifrons]